VGTLLFRRTTDIMRYLESHQSVRFTTSPSTVRARAAKRGLPTSTVCCGATARLSMSLHSSQQPVIFLCCKQLQTDLASAL
jgi:hypothetical protein